MPPPTRPNNPAPPTEPATSMAVLKGHTAAVIALAFSPDRTLLATAALVTGAVLSLAAAAYHLVSVRLRKISVRRWLSR